MPVKQRNTNDIVIWRYPLITLTVIWVVLSVILAVMGPFGSYLSMGFGERFLFWAVVVSSGTYFSHFLRLGLLKILGNRRHQFSFDAIMSVVFAVFYVPPLTYLVEIVTEGRAPYSMTGMFGFVFAVTAVLIVIREVLGLNAPGLPGDDDSAPAEDIAAPQVNPAPDTHEGVDAATMPPILERLPEAQRGAVWLISGSDHYVEVRTEGGSSSILLRFTDAMREVEPVPGQRVHRSHWVADAAVARMRRDGKRHFVVLKTGDEVPVSRTYVDVARQRWQAAAE